MQSEFFKAICQMGIFIICAQSIVHFRPNASYEKYLKLLVGVLLLIQIFLPVSRLLFGDGSEAFLMSVQEFETDLQKSMDEALDQADQSQRLLEQMTLEEVRKSIEEQQANDQAGEMQKEPEGGQEHSRESAESTEAVEPPASIYVEPVEEIRIQSGGEDE